MQKARLGLYMRQTEAGFMLNSLFSCVGVYSMRIIIRLCSKPSACCGIAIDGAVFYLHLILPRQAVSALCQILNVGELGIRLSAGICHITTMSQIVDIVFQSPFSSGRVCLFGEDFSRDDLIGISLSLYQHSPVIVGDLSLAKIVEYSVISGQVHGLSLIHISEPTRRS